jgi:uncharacterized surface protein with fasciclin (FAS1) repeats
MRTTLIAAVSAAAFGSMGACAMNTGMDAGMNGSMGGRSMSTGGSVMVGGAAMLPSRNIVQNAMNSSDHTTLVAAVRQAGLVETLSGPGPFTVFAPTNAAFSAVPSSTVSMLMMDANRAQLGQVLTYHVVPGRLTAADLMARIRAGGGRTTLRTVAGGNLTVSMMGDRLMITDGAGGMSHVTIGDVMQSNGVIHVVDKVLMAG